MEGKTAPFVRWSHFLPFFCCFPLPDHILLSCPVIVHESCPPQDHPSIAFVPFHLVIYFIWYLLMDSLNLADHLTIKDSIFINFGGWRRETWYKKYVTLRTKWLTLSFLIGGSVDTFNCFVNFALGKTLGCRLTYRTWLTLKAEIAIIYRTFPAFDFTWHIRSPLFGMFVFLVSNGKVGEHVFVYIFTLLFHIYLTSNIASVNQLTKLPL